MSCCSLCIASQMSQGHLRPTLHLDGSLLSSLLHHLLPSLLTCQKGHTQSGAKRKLKSSWGKKIGWGEEVHLLDETILVNQVVVRDDAPLLLQLQTSPCRPRVSPHVPPIEPGETSKEMRKVEIGIQLNFGIPVGISRNVFLFRCQKSRRNFCLPNDIPKILGNFFRWPSPHLPPNGDEIPRWPPCGASFHRPRLAPSVAWEKQVDWWSSILLKKTRFHR